MRFRFWGDDTSKVLIMQAKRSEFQPPRIHIKPSIGVMFIIPTLWRWKQTDPWGLLARQPRGIKML